MGVCASILDAAVEQHEAEKMAHEYNVAEEARRQREAEEAARQQQQQQQARPTAFQYADFQTVDFQGHVEAATYGPAGNPTDYTEQVNDLISQGRTHIEGGIHTVIGDPAPGVAKTFTVWYVPSATYNDFETVQFQGPVGFATYGPQGNPTDVTDKVNDLISQGRTHIEGGIHTVVGDPAPGVAKQFKVFYSPNGAALAPVVVHQAPAPVQVNIHVPVPQVQVQVQVQEQHGDFEQYADFATIHFHGKVEAATYGPQGSHNDYTEQINDLINNGQHEVHGGIHTVIGDPAPGVAKTFKVWYAPSQTYADFEAVHFNGPVGFATYGPQGSHNDYTEQVNDLINNGQHEVHGGIHTAIGDPAPGVAKTFKVYYG